MEKRTTINLGGRNVEATEIDFKSIKEDWNEYQAEDGTIIRLKLIATEMYRLDEYDQDNKPIYIVKSSNVLSSSVPEHLKKGAARIQ